VGSWLKPVAVEVEETMVGPMTGGREEDNEEEGAVYAWPVEEVCAYEKEEDEYRRGIGGYKEERKPAP
jgi:hypothetical protein